MSQRVANIAVWFARLSGRSQFGLDSRLTDVDIVEIAIYRAAEVARGIIRGFGIAPTSWVFVGSNVRFRHRRKLYVCGGVTIGDGAVINALSVHGVHIARGVTIGSNVVIEASGVARDIGFGCAIGTGSAIGRGSFVGAAGGVSIGSDVLVGNCVSFHAENHVADSFLVPIKVQGVHRSGIRVDDGCWIGANVTILDGVTVGEGAVVGAGAVVTKDVPPMAVVVGSPARIVRFRSTAPSLGDDGVVNSEGEGVE